MSLAEFLLLTTPLKPVYDNFGGIFSLLRIALRYSPFNDYYSYRGSRWVELPVVLIVPGAFKF